MHLVVNIRQKKISYDYIIFHGTSVDLGSVYFKPPQGDIYVQN